MGLGGGPSEWDEYEWVRLADALAPGATGSGRAAAAAPRSPGADGPGERTADGVGPAPAGPALTDALDRLLADGSLWVEGAGARLLLVDLDNLRAGPARWRTRIEALARLARAADHVALAGQQGAVERARPWLGELATQARAVADGSDLADLVLLAAADAWHEGPSQAVVVSNDGIFAEMAAHGRLVVLSPGADALSDKLRDAATTVVDLGSLEAAAREPAER
jgi:hypothetical protein